MTQFFSFIFFVCFCVNSTPSKANDFLCSDSNANLAQFDQAKKILTKKTEKEIHKVLEELDVKSFSLFQRVKLLQEFSKRERGTLAAELIEKFQLNDSRQKLSDVEKESLAKDVLLLFDPYWVEEHTLELKNFLDGLELQPEVKEKIARDHIKKFPAHHDNIGEVILLYSLSSEKKVVLERIAFAQNPKHYMTVWGIPGLEETPSIENLKSGLKKLSIARPDILPKIWIDVLWDRVQSVDTGLKILKSMYQLSRYKIDTLPAKNSLEVLCEASGCQLSSDVADKMSPKELNELYDVFLDVGDRVSTPLFKSVTLDPQLYTEEHWTQFKKFLSSAEDFMRLHGDADKAWESVLSLKPKTASDLTPSALETINTQLSELVEGQLKELFEEQKEGMLPRNIKKVKEKWGTIEPFITLGLRYRESPDVFWNSRVPVVGRIFRSVLDEKFNKYKFQGWTGDEQDQKQAENQLKMLKTKEQRDSWEQSHRSRLGLYQPIKGKSKSERLDDAKKIIQDTFSLFLSEHQMELDEKDKVAILSAFDEKEDPQITLDSLKRNRGSDDFKNEVLQVFFEDFLKNQNFEELKNRSRVLKNWSQRGLGVTQKESSALMNIFLLMNENPKGAHKKRLIFSVLTSDPRTSLTIGSVVDCGSCQNHQTGRIIEALPSFSIDANTQVLVSFALSPEHFEKKDFDLIADALDEKVPIKKEFDGERRVVTFEFTHNNEKQKITSQFLGTAYLRYLLRLGATDEGVPGIQREKPYFQYHPAMKLMEDQLSEIELELAKDIKGVTDQKITVVKSRNDGLSYSDRSEDGEAQGGDDDVGGLVRDDYVIRPSYK